MGVAVGVLGPPQLVVDGIDATPRAPKERALLALLVVEHGRVVSVDRLIEELWPGLSPDAARRTLQVRVAALRKLLKDAGAPALVEFLAGGYRLQVRPGEVDTHRFSQSVEEGRRRQQAGDAEGAATCLREALGLWRGEPLADVRGGLTLEAEAARLAEERLSAIEDRIEADLACGRHRPVIAELEALVAMYPLRERLWAQRILALYRCGRQADALRAYAEVRARLVSELGVEPGPALRAVEAAVLAQHADLDWVAAPVASRASSPAVDRDARPPVCYAKTTDGVNIAYQVAGDGPVDLIVIPGFTSHLDVWWDAWSGRLARRLATFSRLIVFDKRGVGLSDRPPRSGIDDWVEDTRAVLDAVGSQRAAVLGMSAGGTVGVKFAATYPERTQALILYGATARYLRADDYPIGADPTMIEPVCRRVEAEWGTGIFFDRFCPTGSANPVLREQYARFQRESASPGAAVAYLRALLHTDVRQYLPAISAPTLVVHATGDRTDPVERARYMADRIPGAEMVELDSDDHLIWLTSALDDLVETIRDFLSERRGESQRARVLTTLVYIDVDSWPDHGSADGLHRLVERHGGRTVRSTDHGLLVTVDRPGSAIACALAVVNHVCAAGVDVRAGLHTGECEVVGDDVAGLAVAIARAVADLARPGEILVTQTVRDLVAGSDLAFDAGVGAPARSLVVGGRTWRVHAVVAPGHRLP